jgi:phenylalanyl-tRNA synthetase beta chain
MKISYNWLTKYIDTGHSAEEIAEKLTAIGLEVEEIYPYSTVPELPEGLLIGEVLTVIPHPNAERLRLTTVNIGEAGPLNIVCGAPNVAEGQKVIVATIGTELTPNTGEPFKIGKSKIRGEASEGMLCAEDEIGLGASHAGIMVLPQDAPVGEKFRNYISGYRDTIIEIGLTPNRVDAANHMGVARDLSALLNKPLQEPVITSELTNSKAAEIQIEIEDNAACPRYSGLVIKGIKVQESPEWLKNHLLSIGLKPINNIVDTTNYVMMEMGQPLHAFDLKEIKGNKIIIRKANPSATLVTLDKAERKLTGSELLICNAEEPMALAGVFGGLNSGISEETQDIFIESAHFDPATVRKAARQHGLFTDASFRFERGSDPNITVTAAKRAADIILEIAGGDLQDHLYDIYPVPVENKIIRFSLAYLDKVAGNYIDRDEAASILNGLGISIIERKDEEWLLEIPTYKRDVTRPVDVVEEIMRIYSFDRINFTYQIKSVLQNDPLYEREKRRNKISSYLISQGFFEAYQLSFVPPAYNEFSTEREPVKVLNPLSNELGELRNNMLIPGLKTLEHNLNRQQPDNRFFEWGIVHRMEKGRMREYYRLALWLTGDVSRSNWARPSKKADLFHIKGLVEAVLSFSAKDDLRFEVVEEQGFELFGSYSDKNKKTVAELGKVDADILKQMGIDEEVYYAVFDADALLSGGSQQMEHSSYSRFPRVYRDMALLVPENISYGTIKEQIEQTERQNLKGITVFDVYKGAQVPEGFKSYAIRLEFENHSQTLEDKAVDKMMNRISGALSHKFNINIR